MTLSRRNRRTLEAVARTMIPSGGSIPAGADDLDVARKAADEVDRYAPFAHNQIRLLLFGIEHYPLVSGHVRRFSRLAPPVQAAFLERTAHHKRWLRRLVVSYLKQLVFGMYLAERDVEAAIGYRYQCAKPRAGVTAGQGEQVHH